MDSNKILAHLDAANLFVIPLDEERRWYRYHHLFSDLLRNQLTRLQPDLIPVLHRRASRWYAEEGDIQAAIDHALQDTDLTPAAHLIEQHALAKLYQGQVTMVIGWFERLPERMLGSDPKLCISKAWAFAVMQRGTSRQAEVEQALDTAEHALDQVNAEETLRALVAGHAASIRAFLLQRPALMSKQPERLIALAQEAQRLLPVEEKSIRSVTAGSIGHGYLALADLEASSLAFQQALEDGLSGGNFYAAIYGSINLVFSALLMGRLKEALQLCETNIERFNRILAGQNFPPIGALYILKGSILLEHNQLAEAEQLVTEGLDLIRWTGESIAHKIGYTALARLRALQGDRSAMLEAMKTLEEIWPNQPLYAQTLHYRLSLRQWPDDLDVQKDAYAWLQQSGIDFDELVVINSVAHLSTAYFESYLNAAHMLARLAKEMPGAYPLEGVHRYLKCQQDFAESHGILNWVVALSIARTLLYQAVGKNQEALATFEVALRAAAPTGLFRIFLDECEVLQGLLEQLKPRFRDVTLIAYASRLLGAFSCGPEKPETGGKRAVLLSERELEVLQHLAGGLSYEEIGQKLFLSLNTIQSHVKSIYRKLLVNKRLQAIEKARELKLI
jgi:LuxR family maltose regulon positive regulatory protein